MSTIEKSVLEDLLRREFNFTKHELNVYQNTLALILPAINPTVNEHYYHIYKPLEKTVEQVIALIREKLCKYYDELDKFLETRYYRGAKTRIYSPTEATLSYSNMRSSLLQVELGHFVDMAAVDNRLLLYINGSEIHKTISGHGFKMSINRNVDIRVVRVDGKSYTIVRGYCGGVYTSTRFPTDNLKTELGKRMMPLFSLGVQEHHIERILFQGDLETFKSKSPTDYTINGTPISEALKGFDTGSTFYLTNVPEDRINHWESKTAGSKVKNISFDMKVGEYVYHAVPGNESTSQPYKLFTIAKA